MRGGAACVLILLALVPGVVAAQPTSSVPANAPATPAPVLCVQPLRPVDLRFLPAVVRGIEALYGVAPRTLPTRRLPKKAYTRARKRYRAEKILAWLDAEVVPTAGCTVVVALTAVDISTTKGDIADWGVLGLANLPGSSAVVSSYRAGRGAKGFRHTARRVVSTVNHELGHALGADHDEVPRCLMNDAKGTVRTIDLEDGRLCEASREEIRATLGWAPPALATFDWDAVLAP